MRQFTRQSIWTVLITVMSVVVVAAQGASCTGLLEDALFAVEDNCEGTRRNEVCYGYNQVSASFVSEVDEDFFTQPADLSEISDLETIQTAPLDVVNDIWGVALMNIQANLPNTLPGQSVTFVMLGDVEVGNAVEDTFEPSEGLDVTITSPSGANIRSGAGLNFNVIGGALPDDTFVADSVSSDGDWLRIIYDDRIAWINRVVIDQSVEGLDDLPTLTNNQQTPMQAFYLRTGIGTPECEDAPDDVLIVQGPENIEVTINVNGVNVDIGSTVAIRWVEDENGNIIMQFIGISGTIVVDGVRVPPGFVTTFRVTDSGIDAEGNPVGEGEFGIPTLEGGPTVPEFLEGFSNQFCLLEGFPSSLLQYSISRTCELEEIYQLQLLQQSRAQQQQQQQGSSSQQGTNSATTSQVDGVDCSNFGLVSPLEDMNSGFHVFQWTEAVGENVDYVLVFYNSDGIEAPGPVPLRTSDTELGVNLGADTGTGGAFSWEVRAYQNGSDYACVTNRSPQFVRTGELNPEPKSDPAPASTFTASRSCEYDYEGTFTATITWSNAPGATTVTISDYYGTSTSSGGTSGSVSVSSYSFYGFSVSSGGQTINLSSC